MLDILRSDERGRTELGWLDSRHSFSFGSYRDRARLGFGPIRVINEDRVAPGGGFPTHPHRDMEILTWVLEGALEHEDSMGNSSVIQEGDLQRMSAGTGVEHSEFNHSKEDPVHFLQIWIVPERRGAEPGYAQGSFLREHREGPLLLLASRDGRGSSLPILRDVDLWAAELPVGAECVHELAPGRRAWVQVTRGELTLCGERLHAGDGAAVTEVEHVVLTTEAPADALIFDLEP